VRLAVAGLLLTLLAGAALFVPAATRSHVVYSSTPNPPPLFDLALLEVGPGQTACTRGIVLDSDAEVLRLNPVARGGAPVPIGVRLTGPGYASVHTLSHYAAAGGLVDVPIARPARTLPATLCLSNRGTRAFALGSSTERRTRSRTVTEVAGRPVPNDPTIQLLRREPRSFASLLPTLLRRAATFKPGFAGPWLFWALALLLVLGLPAGAMYALAVEARQRDPQAAELQQHERAEDGRGVGAAPAQREHAAGGGQPHGDD
jgi:hypothetical protein